MKIYAAVAAVVHRDCAVSIDSHLFTRIGTRITARDVNDGERITIMHNVAENLTGIAPVTSVEVVAKPVSRFKILSIH